VGRWVVVDTGADVTAVRIERVLDVRSFSVEGQDLRCGVGSVTGIDDAGNVFHDRVTYFVNAGMTVLDEGGRIVGRLQGAGHDNFMLQGDRPALESFPDADGDGRRRFVVMAIGPGDRLTIPTSASLPAP